MTARSIRLDELTPDARIARAKRLLSDAIGDLVEAYVAKGVAASEWVDQHGSPLGHYRHLRLFREGILKGVREGQRVLVRRHDIDAYLEEHRSAYDTSSDEVDVSKMMEAIQAGARKR